MEAQKQASDSLQTIGHDDLAAHYGQRGSSGQQEGVLPTIRYAVPNIVEYDHGCEQTLLQHQRSVAAEEQKMHQLQARLEALLQKNDI